MYAQFFGNYLLSRNAITKEQLVAAMQKKSSEQIKLGTLAIHAGYMTAGEVEHIIIEQTHHDKRFGELAIQEGYLTEQQVTELLKSQSPDFLLLGQVLVEDGYLTHQQLQDLIIDYESEDEFYDDNPDYSNETQESIHRMMMKLFILVERPLSPYELSFFHLLFKNLVRFIGDDFMPVPPSHWKEYPTNHCVSQRIDGDFAMKIYIDMTQDVAIEFASRYVDDSFSVFDEFVQSSLEDFLNLHNGLFLVNMSNDYSLELELGPPVEETDELLLFDKGSYLLPIVFPFGTVHFIFELIKTR